MTNPRPAGPPPASQARPTAPQAAAKSAPRADGEGGKTGGKGKKKKSNAAMIGYLISGGIVLVIVIVVLWVTMGGNSIGEPTIATTAPGRLKLIAMNLNVSGFTTPPSEAGNDAYDLYRSAILEAKALCPKDNFGDFVVQAKKEHLPLKNPKFQPILDKLLKAADAGFDRSRDLTFDEVRVDMKNWFEIHPELRAFGRLLQFACMDLAGDGKFSEAEKYARAELVLGLRFWDRGVYVPYRSAGLELISEGLALFQSIYTNSKDEAKLQAVMSVKAQYMPVSEKWTAKEYACSRNAKFPSGDAWNLANNDEDVSWQLEGIMRLGVGRVLRGDRTAQAIETYLKKRSNDRDSRIADRAKEALTFTVLDKDSMVLNEPGDE